MNIENIITEEVQEVDVNKLELPDSMQQEETHADVGSDSNLDSGAGTGSTSLSLEQLAGMIIIGYNAISCAIYRKIEPGFDASLTGDEQEALKEPLETVLKEYNVAVTPVTALAVAVISVNVVKIMQLQAYRKQLQQQQQQYMCEEAKTD